MDVLHKGKLQLFKAGLCSFKYSWHSTSFMMNHRGCLFSSLEDQWWHHGMQLPIYVIDVIYIYYNQRQSNSLLISELTNRI